MGSSPSKSTVHRINITPDPKGDNHQLVSSLQAKVQVVITPKISKDERRPSPLGHKPPLPSSTNHQTNIVPTSFEQLLTTSMDKAKNKQPLNTSNKPNLHPESLLRQLPDAFQQQESADQQRISPVPVRRSRVIVGTMDAPARETPEKAHQQTMDGYKSATEAKLAALEADASNAIIKNKIITNTNKAFFAMKPFSAHWIQKHRTVLCDYINDKPDIIRYICEVSMSANCSTAASSSSIIPTALLVVVNLSDHSRELSKVISSVPGFMQHMYDFLDENASKEDQLTSQSTTLLIRVLMIIHNVAMTDSNIPMLQDMKFTPLLHTFLSFTNDTIRMTAILGIADIMTEDESHYIKANTSVIGFLLRIFSRALDTESRTARDSHGMIWGVLELAKGIGRLARNDGNKIHLVDAGCLPLLLKLAKSTDLEEQKEALKSIWALSFDEHNQDTIILESGLIDFLEKQHKTGAPDIKSTCYGILWTMRNKLISSDKYSELGKRLGAKKTPTVSSNAKEKAELEKSEKEEQISDAARGHVMISYQWGNQELLTKIRDRIRGHNEKVWMDIDDMEGSTLQAMAEAVEQADIVLICMSRKYKDSPNCRAEAEYAHQLRKRVIPLIMEKGYRPDGWLGMILGAKLFYDFSGKYPFESKIEGLLKEIHQTMHGGERTTTPPPPAISPSYDDVDGPHGIKATSQEVLYAPSKPPVTKLSQVKQWSTKQVKDWITKYELIGTGAEKLSGKEIAFLQKLQATAPEFYYKTLKSDVGLRNLKEMANFDEAMDDLP
ncbi:hypothetical protein SNE40_011037 [Patella caerulea]|uniref:TIR domain-containing protein n=1 Tax=Patella caerulea TaxID=87958 RepID=A0AAN8PVI3_PATCE